MQTRRREILIHRRTICEFYHVLAPEQQADAAVTAAAAAAATTKKDVEIFFEMAGNHADEVLVESITRRRTIFRPRIRTSVTASVCFITIFFSGTIENWLEQKIMVRNRKQQIFGTSYNRMYAFGATMMTGRRGGAGKSAFLVVVG